jgi:hypothetical protein
MNTTTKTPAALAVLKPQAARDKKDNLTSEDLHLFSKRLFELDSSSPAFTRDSKEKTLRGTLLKMLLDGNVEGYSDIGVVSPPRNFEELERTFSEERCRQRLKGISRSDTDLEPLLRKLAGTVQAFVTERTQGPAQVAAR